MPALKTPSGMTLKIRAIAATDRDGYIGYDNDLLFHNPQDLKYFRNKTLNHICVMGRKTFESIGKVLPQRQTIVVTSEPREFLEKIAGKHALPSNTPFPLATMNPIEDLPIIADTYGDNQIWICGGASIYSLFRKYIATYVLTEYSISVKEQGVRLGILPSDYDPKLLVRFNRRDLAHTAAATLEFGEFMDFRYTMRAYMKPVYNGLARKAFHKDYGYDNPDQIKRDEVFIDG